MCKVMILTGIEDSGKALSFMKAAVKPMSRMDRDGIGYSAINSQNKLFMQKWHNNDDFLKTDCVVDKQILEELAPYQSRLRLRENYTSYGEVTLDDLKTVTMHTRWATCGKEFENTHPFVDQETSLIHNGTINNSRTLNLNKISTCDSEAALQVYLNKQTALKNSKSAIQDFVDQLTGYWAFGILAKNTEGQYMLDVVREGASLYFCAIPELGKNCYAFATTEDILETGLKEIGAKKQKLKLLKESLLLRFDAITGELVESIQHDRSAGNGKGWGNYSYKKGEDESYFTNKSNITDDKDEDTTSDEYMTNTNVRLGLRIISYDKIMNCDVFGTYIHMPEYIKTMLINREKATTITFLDVISAIEYYEKNSNYKELIEFLDNKKVG